MEKQRYYKIKYGYSASDQVSIPESELERAIYAQVKGTAMQLGNAFVNGRNIIAITPHYHKHTGWYDWYEPSNGDDWAQIKRDCPNYDGIIEHYKTRVGMLMSSGREKEIGQNVELPQLETPKTYIGSKGNGIESVKDVLKNTAEKFSTGGI